MEFGVLNKYIWTLLKQCSQKVLAASWAFCFKNVQYMLTKLHPEKYAPGESLEAVSLWSLGC